eukprot:TRINITY_DN4470_c0_g1_i1.p1 TRINITY_DN4470_c0_g1~~TRINITY_DN4470_c0_g1_i1.p1  ORF type:complete len:453 (+),score=90.52 TRINITY_DN4470_c0_g1_i1:389-1747(+)
MGGCPSFVAEECLAAREAGAILGIVAVVVIGLLNVLTSFWVLEIMARAHGVTMAKKRGSVTRLNNRLSTRDRYDFVWVCHLFAGKTGKYISAVTLSLCLWGCLWTYVSVFASCMSQTIFSTFTNERCVVGYRGAPQPSENCRQMYIVCAFSYGMVVFAVSLVDYVDQALYQIVVLFYKLFGFSMMIVTVLVAMCTNGPMQPTGEGVKTSDFWRVDIRGFGHLFTGITFAFLMQYNIPDAVFPVRQKHSLQRVIAGAVSTVTVVFLAVSLLCGAFFNDRLFSIATFNWESYTGRDGGWGKGGKTWFGWLCTITVLLLPAVDLLSVFPLVAVSLATNMQHMFPDRIISEHPLWTKYSCRFLAAVPPIICGMMESRFTVLIIVTGLLVYCIECFLPCALQVISKRYCHNNYGSTSDHTTYTSVLSDNIVVGLVLALGCISFLTALICACIPDNVH